ncbi:hypothetical protein ElyMa_001170600 [Elysia marginata]|uniref:Uncharacterized protein n=1 Tax=Elysia marginata TaxID=1093978 RepID=A0AAV4I3S6_9GAST|nr:hypothetical protein ElyMa_001170600 [Elysia marginata]
MQQRMHAAGYQLMVEAIDRMVGEALLLRHSMNLPDREQDDIDGDARDSRKGARAAEAKSKGDAGKDKGKGQAKDAKAAKGGAYNILGEMLEKMDTIFAALKDPAADDGLDS